MKFCLNYDQTELQMAAEFIWTNNNYVHAWPSKPTSSADVRVNIMNTIRETASKNAASLIEDLSLGKNSNKWIDYVSIGGYTILYDYRNTDDDGNHIIGVVDPAISAGHEGYTEELFDL